jgi:hypothetical protein
MKKLFIIIVLCVSCSMAHAQIIVSSTTRTSKGLLSNRTTGWNLMPEIGFGADFGTDMFDFENAHCAAYLHLTGQYFITPNIAVGGGFGLALGGTVFTLWYDHEVPETKKIIPLFVNGRAYFGKKILSPYVDLRLGYEIWSREANSSDYSDVYCSVPQGYEFKAHTGLFFGIGIGMEYKSFDYGLQLKATSYRCEYSYAPDGVISYTDYDDKPLVSLTLHLSYRIPLKK